MCGIVFKTLNKREKMPSAITSAIKRLTAQAEEYRQRIQELEAQIVKLKLELAGARKVLDERHN